MGSTGPAWRVAASSVVAGVILLSGALTACSEPSGGDGSADVLEDPAAGLAVVTAESILAATPPDVIPKESFDEPSDGGVARFNMATRTFSAPSEATAATAAARLHDDAIADGWSSTQPEDPDGGGVVTTVLTKGSLVLEISYTTDDYRQMWSDDDDGYEVRVVVTDMPTTDEIPPDEPTTSEAPMDGVG